MMNFKLPTCPICMEEFDTDFSVIVFTTEHSLPVSCQACSAVLCHSCCVKQHVAQVQKNDQQDLSELPVPTTPRRGRRQTRKEEGGLLSCPICLEPEALNVLKPNYNRPFAALLEEVKRDVAVSKGNVPPKCNKNFAQQRKPQKIGTVHSTSPTLQRIFEEALRRAELAEKERDQATEQLSIHLARRDYELAELKRSMDATLRRLEHDHKQQQATFQREKAQLQRSLHEVTRRAEQARKEHYHAMERERNEMQRRIVQTQQTAEKQKQEQAILLQLERAKMQQRWSDTTKKSHDTKREQRSLEAQTAALQSSVQKLEQRAKQAERRAADAEREQKRLQASLLLDRERGAVQETPSLWPSWYNRILLIALSWCRLVQTILLASTAVLLLWRMI